MIVIKRRRYGDKWTEKYTKHQVWIMRTLKDLGLSYRDVGRVFSTSETVAFNCIQPMTERKEMAKRAKGKCEDCGKRKPLRVHHVNYVKQIVKIVCVNCHGKNHRGNPHHSHLEGARQYRQDLIDQAKIDCT